MEKTVKKGKREMGRRGEGNFQEKKSAHSAGSGIKVEEEAWETELLTVAEVSHLLFSLPRPTLLLICGGEAPVFGSRFHFQRGEDREETFPLFFCLRGKLNLSFLQKAISLHK